MTGFLDQWSGYLGLILTGAWVTLELSDGSQAYQPAT